MIREEFDAWSSYHAAAFSLSLPSDVEMFGVWFDAFAAVGFAAAELHEATRWLLVHAPPRYRSEHPDALRRRIMDRRREQSQRNREFEEEPGEICELCRGTGLAQVLRPAAMRDGELVLVPGLSQLGVVTCDCRAGQRIANVTDYEGRFRLTLEAYEQRYPHWRDLLRQREQQQAAMNRARSAGKDADSVIARVASSTRLPPRPESRSAAQAKQFRNTDTNGRK